MAIRNTAATREVLASFVDGGGRETYGLDVIRVTGLASGTVYPILQRLEDEGWLSSRWENINPQTEGRPARRLYRITADGARTARAFEYEIEDRKRRSQRGWQRPLPGTEGAS